MIGRTLLHYEIVSALGEGGMGVVYKARDTHLDRLVAIKILSAEAVADPSRKRRFTLEAKAASALNHPGIITIYDIAEDGGIAFIAMEYVQGKTLGELIGRKGLRLKDTLTCASQAASALAKAHAAGIVHRDLKPSNIMVTDDGLVKILDFGVAKLTMADAEDNEDRDTPTHTMAAKEHRHTEAGKIVGTVAYMSPEQAEGKKVDARSDIFSFGSVLYEMVTGTRAFQGALSVQTLAAVMHDEPKPPSQLASNLPRELERIILRCLRKDPARRFQHMEDLAVELEEIKTDSGTQIAAAHAPSRRRRTRWGIGTAGALALTAASAWLLWPVPLPPPTVEQLTTLFGDEDFPTFSPDGNQVAFAWDGDKGDNIDIYIIPVGASTPVQLTTDPAQDSAPAWSPDGGRIAFVRRRGNDFAIYLVTPPVPNSEQKVRDVRPVEMSSNNTTTVSWFPDGKRLAVAERDGQMNGITVIPLDHGEPRRLLWTAVSKGTYYYPAVSPKGDALSYALCNDFSCNVHVMELGRDLTSKDPSRPLTEQNVPVSGIAWTTDGRSLIFASGSYVKSLWRVLVAGGSPEHLELAGNRAAFPAVSRDGLKLAYSRFGNGSDIWRFGVNGSLEVFGVSSTLDDRNPQFSPDGKRIAFESRRQGKDTQIWVANADGTHVAALTVGAEGNGGSPRWSPDSRSIAFDGQEPDGRRAIYIVDAEGGRPKLLTTGSLPSWSGDGKWIYFHKDQGVWKIPAKSGSLVSITDDGANPLESPDRKTLYYRKGSDPSALVAKPVAGGPEHQVLDSMRPGVNNYFPIEDGIYYVARPDPRQPFTSQLRFLNFATGKHEVRSRFEARAGVGLTVSPDRTTILYSFTRPSDGTDLMLIRNFK